jgi:hypothetical protein
MTPDSPPIVCYLSEAYVWYGDVLDDIEALVQDLRSGSHARDSALCEDSSAYINDFLEPLFQRMCASSRQNGFGQAQMRALLPVAQRLQVAIVSLDWTLKAAA